MPQMQIFNSTNMAFHTIHENKTLTKISDLDCYHKNVCAQSLATFEQKNCWHRSGQEVRENDYIIVSHVQITSL